MPPIVDQGNLGSCTANAIAGAVDYERAIQREPLLPSSRLFIYYNERVIEGDVAEDAGAFIRDGIKAVARQGVCPEGEWPYIENQFAVKPSAQCYTDALAYRATAYARITQNELHTKHCLAILLRPFIFGFTVYESFESDEVANTGIVPMPLLSEHIVGGHAVCAVGYDDTKRMFKCRNSWGTSWGLSGYFWMPYEYVLSNTFTDDLWVITQES